MGTGDTIAERFFVRHEAGRGGMGTVYRAEDSVTGRPIALKILRGEDAVDAARFEREARLLAELSHPHVVGYVDHGVTDRGEVYLAMEWLEGETLADWLSRGAQSPRTAVTLLRGAAAGLGAAHALGIVHRDVKPANLFLVDSDPARVKVLDFGIARGVGAGHTLTHTGTVMGTPHYMAPEQASAMARVDARADVYALGAVLYELLTGRPPFRSESLMAVLAAILLEDPVDVRERARGEIPDGLAELTMRLLSKDPEARPADGRALREELARIDPSGQVTPSIAPPALTEREQRVLCLVLAEGAFDALSNAATLMPGDPDEGGKLRAAVEAHGGAMEILADGSIVARVDPSGTPTDQATRAAHCALAMREVAAEVPLAVVAGRGHFRGPIPVGEVIERGIALLSRGSRGAATLKQGELGGEVPELGAVPILLDDVMANLVADRFEVHATSTGAELGPERSSPTTSRSIVGRGAPFVGRRRELATLAAIYAECVEEPVARAAVITAPAGLGKTRLLGELQRRLEDDGELRGAAVWRAHGDPIAAGSPFGLLGQLVRAFAAIEEGEALEERRRKLGEAVGARFGDQDAQTVAERLGEIARVPFGQKSVSMPPDDPKLRGDAMRDAWLSLLGAELDRAPLLIVLDDLQWGDRPSLRFLDDALRTHAERPLCVIAAGRPEIDERFGDLWAERDAQPMRLTRLRPKAAEELVRHAFEGVDEALLATIVERADGNPFFLEELVRALREGGDSTELPTTVLGMVEARLAELEAPTRRVLRAGSVFGARFWRDAVVELLGGPDRASDVDDHLDVLRRREIVRRQERSAYEGHTQLVFESALTREAAYAMLTDEDRRLGHQLAARWLERAGESDAVRLAEHHARGGEAAAAARWLAAGAEQALEGDDLAACIERGSRALAAIEEPEAGALEVTLADAYRWRGDYPDAMLHATRAAEALEEGSRPWFRALGVLFAAAGRLGRREDAERWRQRAMVAEARGDAPGAQVVALCRAATLALASGDAGRFEATMARAEALAEEAAPGDPLARAWIRTLRASESLRDGDVGAFVDGTEEAVAAYEEAGDLRDACNQRVRLANGYVGLGDAPRAQGVLKSALGAARRMGLSLVEGYALQNLGHALLRQGALEEARTALSRAIDVASRIEDPVLEAGALLYLAEVREGSQPAAAVQDAERAVELLGAVPSFRVVAEAILARALLASGETERALEIATRCHAALGEHTLEEGEALVRLVHVEALRAAGRSGEARAAVAEAVERLEARAERISDRGWRDAFLHRVPVHARLLELQGASA